MDGRDRLRELLDAVLDDDHRTLGEMADGAHVSPYHFTRQLSRAAGEPPVAMKRRVLLERAAWQLRCGTTVTQAAFDAGYESVEGFSRAFTRAYGHPPSTVTTGQERERSATWLPAPNGIHFHPPTSLWVHTGEQPMNPLTDQLLQHDLDDTRALLEQAKQLDEAAFRHEHLPGTTVLAWDGEDLPPRGDDDVAGLLSRHEVVDALCDPPASFVLSGVVAHVLTFSAHRRQLARLLMRAAGLEVDHGDPIEWLRACTGGGR